MVRWQPSPILIKEMRSTMRGARTFWSLTLFLLLLTGFVFLIYYGVTSDMRGSNAAEAGQMIFGFLGVIELIMLAVIVPALTSGAVASERQKQTFDILMATPLSPRQVLQGKFLASMNYLFLLIFATLPINAVVFLFGGVEPAALLWWLALALALLTMLGTMGLMMSTLFKGQGSATAVMYLTCALIFVVLPVVLSISAELLLERDNCFFAGVVLLHPAGSLFSILNAVPGELTAIDIVPVVLPLYLAMAGIFFMIAQARLSAMVGQSWRHLIPFLVLMAVIAIMAATYIMVDRAWVIC